MNRLLKAFARLLFLLPSNAMAEEAPVEFLRPYKPGETLLQRCDEKTYRCGLMDITGKDVIAPRFWAIASLAAPNDGSIQFLAKVDSGSGIFDGTGAWLTPTNNTELDFFEGGLARFRTFGPKNKDVGFYNMAGRVAIEPMFDQAWPFSGPLAPVQPKGLKPDGDEQMGMIDKAGIFIVPAKYRLIRPYAEGFAAFTRVQNGMYIAGFFDEAGKEVLGRYNRTENFRDGLAPITTESGKIGLINTTGKFVVPPKYDFLDSHSEGLVAYLTPKVDWGFLSLKTGKPAFPLTFQHARPFSQGVAAVAIAGKWGFINTKGQWVCKPTFDNLESLSSSLVAPANMGALSKEEYELPDGGLWGAITPEGKWILEAKYEKVTVTPKVIFAYTAKTVEYYTPEGVLIGTSYNN